MAARLSVVLVLLGAIALVTSCVNGTRDLNPLGKLCTQDTDCFPNICKDTGGYGACAERKSKDDHKKGPNENCVKTRISECMYPMDCKLNNNGQFVCQ